MSARKAVGAAARAAGDAGPLTDEDIRLFHEGSHARLYEKLGAHVTSVDGVAGTYFAVWAPDAARVSVVGDFNDWDPKRHELRLRGSPGIWEAFVPEAGEGMLYKFHVTSRYKGHEVYKADPFGLYHEVAPKTASIVWDLDYAWDDGDWMAVRGERNSLHAPMSIYEVHVGSWMRVAEENNRSLSYRELAPKLAEYANKLGFTHVELMPVMEHPFFGSWGYQVTGYFAPTSRYGTPQDFMYLVDYLHQEGIGVILDWVPSHFPNDVHGLGFFDGTHLYEHGDPRRGIHPEWDSYIFDYSRPEVRSFLVSNALFWLDRYHADGLRVDSVSSMLYLDYARAEGEWLANEHGGRENLGAVELVRRLNDEVYRAHPDTQTMAEEASAWPHVTGSTGQGGLGFGLKWDLGWTNDTLSYVSREPSERPAHHNELTFRMMYAFDERFVLPLSHDQVVKGQGSLLGKMPGDEAQRFANLRLLLSYMYSQPGKKLLFMGGEFGQREEWAHDGALSWEFAELPAQTGIQRLVEALNRLYREEPALHELDCEAAGFEWIDPDDAQHSTLSYLRRSASGEAVAIALNFSAEPREGYRLGVPSAGLWRVLLNTDAAAFGGSDQTAADAIEAEAVEAHGRTQSLRLTLPALAAVFFKAD